MLYINQQIKKKKSLIIRCYPNLKEIFKNKKIILKEQISHRNYLDI